MKLYIGDRRSTSSADGRSLGSLGNFPSPT